MPWGDPSMDPCGISLESLGFAASTGSCVMFDTVLLPHVKLGDALDGLASGPTFRRDASLRISFLRSGPLSLRLSCAWREYFCVGSMVLGNLVQPSLVPSTIELSFQP
eukprot:Gb_05971 [translate_table: standard]